MSEREEVTRYRIGWNHELQDDFVTCEFGEFVRYDDYAALRAALTTAERERDEARRERDAMESMYRHHVNVALDAIAKLNHAQAILNALREPSEAVVVACARALRQRDDGVTWDTWDSIKYQTRQQMMEEARPIVLAAVAAAEQEATP